MNKQILAVDDDESSLENLSLSLKSKNYTFDLADSYKTAIAALNNNNYDILIADLKLPYKSGIDVIKFAMENKSAKSTILITGFADEPAIAQALKMGVDDILKKPYNDHELHSTIIRLLKSQELDEENHRLKEK